MEDPGKLLEQGAAAAMEVSDADKLRADLREGQRLLILALGQRDVERNTERLLLRTNVIHIELLNDIAGSWWFRFLPRRIKERIIDETASPHFDYMQTFK